MEITVGALIFLLLFTGYRAWKAEGPSRHPRVASSSATVAGERH